jgi:hypothetical protein
VPLLILFALSLVQEPLPPEMRQLVRIKQRMSDNLRRLPNYTCQAELSRFEHGRRDTTWLSTDSFQLEVALVGDDEWFSHPGAGRLETRNLREMIPTGLLSTGDYANHTRAVFLSSDPRFEYAGMERIGEHNTVRFNYKVSLFGSGYRMSLGPVSEKVAYHGSFWGDPETGDLVRLDVHTDDMPPSLDMQEAATTVDYARVRIGATDFLLPQRTELVVVRLNGAGERNQMLFSHCRQYGTESAVSFEQPASLPAGLTLALKLATALDSQNTHPGDAVAAEVVAELRHQGERLVPAGAKVRGRVLQLENLTGTPPTVRVVLQFDDIAAGEIQFPFTAVLESLPDDRRLRRSTEVTPLPGILAMLVRERPFHLEGLVTRWRTQ